MQKRSFHDKQRNKRELVGLSTESAKSISTTTDTSDPGAGEGAEVLAEVHLLCQYLKEILSEEALHHLTQRAALTILMPFQELQLLIISATFSMFLPHPNHAKIWQTHSPANTRHSHLQRLGFGAMTPGTSAYLHTNADCSTEQKLP